MVWQISNAIALVGNVNEFDGKRLKLTKPIVLVSSNYRMINTFVNSISVKTNAIVVNAIAIVVNTNAIAVKHITIANYIIANARNHIIIANYIIVIIVKTNAIVVNTNRIVVNTNAIVVKHITIVNYTIANARNYIRIANYILAIIKIISVPIRRAHRKRKEKWLHAMIRSVKPNWSLGEVMLNRVP